MSIKVRFKFYFENHNAKHALIILSHNEIKCFNKVGKFIIFVFFFDDLHLKLFKVFPPYFTGSSLALVNKAQ